MSQAKQAPLPCPFCGSDDLAPAFFSEDSKKVCVACENCDSEGPPVLRSGNNFSDLARAYERWNARAVPKTEAVDG